jgi:hypothetical protein
VNVADGSAGLPDSAWITPLRKRNCGSRGLARQVLVGLGQGFGQLAGAQQLVDIA